MYQYRYSDFDIKKLDLFANDHFPNIMHEQLSYGNFDLKFSKSIYFFIITKSLRTKRNVGLLVKKMYPKQ